MKPDALRLIAGEIARLDATAETAAAEIRAAVAPPAETSKASNAQTGDAGLRDLAAAVIERTEAIRADCAALSALLQKATRVVGEADDSMPTPPEPVAASNGPVPPAGKNAPATASSSDSQSVTESAASEPDAEMELPDGASEGVRLLATQMAIAGSSRSQIERHLQQQFGVDDAREALDQIFGSRQPGG